LLLIQKILIDKTGIHFDEGKLGLKYGDVMENGGETCSVMVENFDLPESEVSLFIITKVY
jgi:hypothetical protein